jgi:hypothetical protein
MTVYCRVIWNKFLCNYVHCLHVEIHTHKYTNIQKPTHAAPGFSFKPTRAHTHTHTNKQTNRQKTKHTQQQASFQKPKVRFLQGTNQATSGICQDWSRRLRMPPWGVRQKGVCALLSQMHAIYIYIYIYTHTHTHIHTQTNKHSHTDRQRLKMEWGKKIFVHTHIHPCLHAYIDAYVRTYIHKYIHMQTTTHLKVRKGLTLALSNFNKDYATTESPIMQHLLFTAVHEMLYDLL